jgi:hypothetical protein
MKIEIEVLDKNIHNALSGPHSRYWTNECSWDDVTWEGYVIDSEEESAPIIELDQSSVRKALEIMGKEFPNLLARLVLGETDGVDGDSLLQLMAFGELKYG